MHRVNQIYISSSSSYIRTSIYWPSMKYSGGTYTMDELYKNVDILCKLYGFEIIDIYNNSCLNGVSGLDYDYVIATPSTKSSSHYYYNCKVSSIEDNGNGTKTFNGTVNTDTDVLKNSDGEKYETIAKWDTAIENGGHIFYNTKVKKSFPCTDLRPINNSELLDAKGIHPTTKGYKIGYEPHMKEALRKCIKIP